MKKISLKCESCGGTMQVSPDKTEATCPYCKHKFLIQKDPTLDELKEKEEKLSYAREKGIRDAISENKRKNRKHTILTMFFAFIGIIVIAVICTFVDYFAKEYMENPFKCIDVSFAGIEGKGKLIMNDNNSCENYSDLKFMPTKENNLNQNEKIKIVVTSDKFRFDEMEKEYTVTELSEYLKDLNNLTSEMINKIHKTTKAELQNMGSVFYGKVASLEPYKFYLYTNNDKSNILYDVYKAKIKTRSGKVFVKYKAVYYENFAILNTKELFTYAKSYQVINSVLAGDPKIENAGDNNYAGYTYGFLTIDDFKIKINKENDGTFVIKER